MEGGRNALRLPFRPTQPDFDPLLDNRLGDFLLDPEVSLQDVQDRQVGHRASVVETSPLQIGAVPPGKAAHKLQEEPRLANARVAYNSDHLARPGAYLLPGLSKVVYLLAAAHEFRESPRLCSLDSRLHPGRAEQLVRFLQLLLPLYPALAERLKLEVAAHQLVGVPGDKNRARSREILHPKSKVRGVPQGGVVHPQIVPDAAHDHRSRVETHAHREIQPEGFPNLLPVRAHGTANRKGCVTASLRVVLVGHRGTKQGHYAIPGELIDRSLIPVDLFHQDLETPVHDLVNFLRRQLLRDAGIVRHIDKQDGDHLALPFDRAPGG